MKLQEQEKLRIQRKKNQTNNLELITFMKRKMQEKGKSETKAKKNWILLDYACHPCAGAMLIFSVSFQF